MSRKFPKILIESMNFNIHIILLYYNLLIIIEKFASPKENRYEKT